MSRDLAPATPESVGLSQAGLDAIDGYLKGLVDEGTLAGVVTLVARHGKTVHTSVIGKKDLASGEPLALDTIFRIFSMTKPVTGVAMSILWDEGKWSPDDPIAKHLPSFADVRVFDGLDEKGEAKTVAPDHAPTMRELMTHTAGLSYGFNQQDPLDKLYQAKQVWQSASLAEFADKVASLPLAYQPGSKWLYSLSMDVQGAIIEKLSGQTLPEFMRARIFEPLGMVDTAFHTPPEKAARRATLYRWSPSRKTLLEAPNILGTEHDKPPRVANGGGGLVSTLSDYAKFAQMLLNGGEFGGQRIVSAAALKQQMTNHLPEEMLETRYGVGAQQIRPGFGYGFNGAVFTDPAKAGVPVGKGTYHWDGAAGTWFWVDPLNDLLYVALIQLLSESAPPLQKTTQTMMANAFI
ncbi:MAG TPA: serine hydrolase domain-containing protein [Caulobacteraceae bacterium]|jgi:CubicO group peptidase (beta-lactamase class C family)|nr:serine hydrolase domain-containing protein [Caulobacteraceae bacterium]